jgi:hypothetical protein
MRARVTPFDFDDSFRRAFTPNKLSVSHPSIAHYRTPTYWANYAQDRHHGVRPGPLSIGGEIRQFRRTRFHHQGI